MRGVARTVGLALAAGLIVTGSASAVLGLDDPLNRIDPTKTVDREEMRVLLPDLTGAPDSALELSLPGSAAAEAPLQPDERVLSSSPLLASLPGSATTTIDLGVDDVDEATSTVDEATDTQTTSQDLDQPRLSDASASYDGVLTTDDASADSSDSDSADTSAQSASASDAGPAEKARQAWNNLDDGEKAAVSVGLISLLLGPLAMYSRIKRSEVLDNDTRREIYELIESDPGVCIQDAADRAGVSYSTASYHLKRLVKMDYVERREDGNKVRYYKNGGTFTQAERELVPVLKNDEAMAVFQHIVENPWCYRAEVAEALGVSHTTVNWHLDRLQDVDLVEEHREGRNCHLHVDDDALDRVTSTIDKLDAADTQPKAPEPKAVPA